MMRCAVKLANKRVPVLLWELLHHVQCQPTHTQLWEGLTGAVTVSV